MLILSGVIAAVLPPALVWRILLKRTSSGRLWMMAMGLAGAAAFAGWRATSAVAEGELSRLRAAFREGPPVEWGVLDVGERRAALDDAELFMAQGRIAGMVPGLALALGLGLVTVLVGARVYSDRQRRRFDGPLDKSLN